MLQRVAATQAVLTVDSPFWLRLELHHTAVGLQAARADIAACCGALLGDVHWNPHLLAVYAAASEGRAIWAQGRPLAAWFSSLADHVSFLTAWKAGQPTDEAPFRLGSVGDVASFLSSYSNYNR